MSDSRNFRGFRDKVFVSPSDLRELIYHYEEMDATERALHPEARRQEIEHQLHNLLTALYLQENKNSEITMMVIMKTLLPLMEAKQQESQRFPENRYEQHQITRKQFT